MRVWATLAIALALIAGTVTPAFATAPSLDELRALALINSPCLPDEQPAIIAQAAGEATAAPTPDGSDASPVPTAGSPSPSPSPSQAANPVIPRGPGVLVPPPLPSTSPQITPPPMPTPTPTSSSAGSLAPVMLTPVTPSPVPTATAIATSGPLSPAGKATPVASPSPGETLGPNDYAVLGDHLVGNRTPGSPFDLDGHVNVFYQDGVLVGDHAHYDGERYLDITGNTLLRNRTGDSTLTADSIRFDTTTQKATLINGRGVSTQGVQSGNLHFTARQLTTSRDGVTHGERASLTTCENPHGGYHIEAKTLDITPGDKAIARAAVLFLGPLAILYLPIIVIPLRRDPTAIHRQPGLVPLIGYSAAEGYYVKAKIGFSPSQYYYGYYRVEYYSKLGYGLGYVASFRRKDQKRSTDVDAFRMFNKTDNSQNWNINLTDSENFSPALRSTERFSYQGDYGPLISLPASISLALGLTKTSKKDTENFSFARQSTGGEVSSNNYGFSDTYQFSPKLSNQMTISFTTNSSAFSGISNVNTNFHLNTDTHLTGNTYDYDMIIDRYDASTPSGANKLPEFLIRPHSALFPGLKSIPTTASYTIGEYSDPTAMLATSRAEAQLNFGPALAHLPVGDFNASVNIRQDAYGTGDAKAQISQLLNLSTPLGAHFNNTLSYTNQHVNGLGDEPFTFDTIGGAYKNLQENFRVFNGDVYALSLQTGTAFNRAAQPIQYQLLTRPSPRSSLILGGVYTPGPGFGFDRTNVQVVTPFGRGSDIQISTFIDWKNHQRLESKSIYYRRIIGDCYEFRLSYNEDLKTVALTIDILAFPSQALNFGLGQQTSIIPQSFASDQFTGGSL